MKDMANIFPAKSTPGDRTNSLLTSFKMHAKYVLILVDEI
jgi:hypothetical protein